MLQRSSQLHETKSCNSALISTLHYATYLPITSASPPPRRKESFRFCPRVFANFRYFSQKSALKRAKFRAPDWTYVATSRSCMRAEEQAHIYAYVCPLHPLPPLRRIASPLEWSNSRTILSESFRQKEALFPEKCTKTAQNPCAPLGL